MDTQDERVLRDWLAKQLKRDDIPSSLWARLKDELYVSEVLEGFIGREDLLKEARKQIALSCEVADEWRGGSASVVDHKATSATSDTTSPASKAIFTEYERDRGEAFTEYLTKLAEGSLAVQNFRTQILGHDKLSQVQAKELVTSPSLRFLPPYWFKVHCIPILGSKVRITGQEWRPSSEIPNYADLIIHVELPDGRKDSEEIFSSTERQADVLALPYIEGLRRREIQVWPGSILGILRNLSVALAQEFPWREEDAAWFLLTGEPPHVPLLDWSDRRYGENNFEHWSISMIVAPWISVETVERFYRYRQRVRFGHNIRPLSERNIAVFRFVIGNLRPDPDKMDTALSMRGVPTSVISKHNTSVLGGPSWRALLDLWNRAHPEWEYKDVRLFSRDFYRAHLTISGSNYPRSNYQRERRARMDRSE